MAPAHSLTHLLAHYIMTNEEIKAQLEAAKAEAEAARNEAAAAKLALEKAEAAAAAKSTGKINGSYKGHQFVDNHKKVRNAIGELCDTEKLLAAAADKESDGHAEAVALLDWLLDIKYAYLVKAK